MNSASLRCNVPVSTLWGAGGIATGRADAGRLTAGNLRINIISLLRSNKGFRSELKLKTMSNSFENQSKEVERLKKRTLGGF